MVCVPVVQNEGLTALHWAASNGHVDVVKALLAAGANVTARSVRGDMPWETFLCLLSGEVQWSHGV